MTKTASSTLSKSPRTRLPFPAIPDMALASMGIYVFETKFLSKLLQEDAANTRFSRDFGKDIIPKS